MQRTARLAKSGGVLLTGVSLGIACQQIELAKTLREKNEIFVETAGGVAGGLLYTTGASVAILLVSTPVGWVAGLAIGLGAAVTGYLLGKAAVKIYDRSGARVDFVNSSGAGILCSANSVRRMPTLSPATLSVL